MFREFLKKDLIGIFEKEEVDFSNSPSHLESELGVIFVVIDPDGVKNHFRNGENYFSVIGKIEFLDDATHTSFGFFSQRMALSKYESVGNFRLIGRESNDSVSDEGERLLVKKSHDFSYRISIPYNKSIGYIEGLDGNLVVI